jgi:uncharacterized protein (TIGR00730 family)
MKKNICVFCSSSDRLSEPYIEAAECLADFIIKNDDLLIYGGSHVGLMKCIAERIKTHGGHITGIIPQKIYDKGIANQNADRLMVASDMQERKRMLINAADAFIVLPGGFGTIDELMDVITEKQLRYHDKPIVLLNVDGFFDPLLTFFQSLINLDFVKSEYEKLWFVGKSIDEAYSYINSYTGSGFAEKWF